MILEKNISIAEQQQYIIAIGASAGGLQEINSFFDHTPLDGVSYVIIQHLSENYKSMMAGLLSKHSELEICEAENDMLVEPNKVYLIPSKNYMTISNGRLLLTEKHKTGLPHLTINTFFNSLALDIGNRAIAVVLSGTGSDGTEGTEAIKKAGGMVMASDPAIAEYKEMPLNAIDTGLVDFVSLPSNMPGIIENYVNKNRTRAGNITENWQDEKARVAIVEYIKEHFPHDFSEYKKPTILRRIKRRALYHNITNLQTYFNFLKTNPDEVNALCQDFLISVTSFFRDKETFDFLQNNVIRDIIERKSNHDELKIWVAGCATGEEAYSFSILIQEELNRVNKNILVKIFATDIDNIALSYAKTGIYDESITGTVSPERLELFFTKDSGGYKVKQVIRKMLIFSHNDLVKNPPYCNMDLISCRNLLIYMNQPLQKKVLAMLQFGVKKDGYLVLGSSENIMEKTPYLEEVNKHLKIYKVLEARRNLSFDVFSQPAIPDTKTTVSAFTQSKELQNKNEKLKEYLNETLMGELGYTGVCIDQNNYVVRSFGDISKYMLPKMFNFDLGEVLPKPLSVAFKNASQESLKTNKKVTVKGIKIKYNNAVIVTELIVIPLNTKKTDQKLVLVLFNDNISPDVTGKDGVVYDEKIYVDQYIINLEEELKLTKEKLLDVFEKLDVSNENMQSFNEELLSTNEEMQSTNEEMQSVNEELHTINSEYQTKIKELSNLNDDLNNYFRSNENGQLFINNRMLLMKFTPSAVKHINLLETDIGRPISNISANIRNETLENDARKVIAHGEGITREVEAINGKWYQMMTMPYIREKDNKMDGVIITFNDITELKKTQTELDRTNKTLTTINADLDNFVYSASHDLLGPLTNIEQIISLLDARKEDFDEEVNEYHRLLRSSVAKFKTLIRDLAVVGKIESEVFETDPIDLMDLINEIKLSIQDMITTTKAGISTDLNVMQIGFSKKNLRSILYNLINNAIKFRSPQRGIQIVISTAMEDGLMLLSVQDNGLGIPREELKNVFSMYNRIHQDIEGQGIGLYLVKKIVDASGGKVVVESDLGKGSKFKIYFKV
ncbi:MAG TPA: CheR family methyltransferase [Ferruginibacter sp.]|nr:CheR family methyltransferase [Ferruginibacter sp.]